MAKKAKQEKKWVPLKGERVWWSNIEQDSPAADRLEYDVLWLGEYRAGLIYRTKREALACARRMLRAAKEG